MNLPTDKHYVPGFHFDPEKVCYCGSGNLFGRCCASTDPDRNPPAGIMVIDGFLSVTECDRFLQYVSNQPREWLTVLNHTDTETGESSYRRDPARVAENVDPGEMAPMTRVWMEAAVRQFVAPVASPEWFETPHLLCYGPGGKYVAHSDAEHFDSEQGMYYRIVDRDFSLLIYFNDDYEGGSLRFEHLNYEYKPRAGDLLVFPSNHVFSHESTPVTSGTKYALVSWGVFRDTPRVLTTENKILIS